MKRPTQDKEVIFPSYSQPEPEAWKWILQESLKAADLASTMTAAGGTQLSHAQVYDP